MPSSGSTHSITSINCLVLKSRRLMRRLMSLRDFITKQFIDVIEWVEPEEGILAYRYPMQDREIQNGGKVTVRDSHAAVLVHVGKVADIFGPGLYTLTTQTLPILTYLSNWDKAFNSPF